MNDEKDSILGIYDVIFILLVANCCDYQIEQHQMDEIKNYKCEVSNVKRSNQNTIQKLQKRNGLEKDTSKKDSIQEDRVPPKRTMDINSVGL